jgi:hypothetical protein
VLYTGSRTSEALMVDMETGHVVQHFKGPSVDKVGGWVLEGPLVWCGVVGVSHTTQQQQPRRQVASMLDPRLQGEAGGAPPTPLAGKRLLWVGRVDYSLRALDTATGGRADGDGW